MTKEENIRAILECNFAGYKEEVIDIAVKRICELEQEPKTGKWYHYEGMIKCTKCNMEFYDDIMEYCGDDVPRYCPNCGCKMESEGKE